MIIRTHIPSDFDYILGRQITMYAEENGFTSEQWKTYLREGVTALFDNYDESRDRIFIAEEGGQQKGCMCVTHAEAHIAHLRFFFLEPECRGSGYGEKLFRTALDFCRSAGYIRAFLWTGNIQEAARYIYSKYGFSITETVESDEWGALIIEERWDAYL